VLLFLFFVYPTLPYFLLYSVLAFGTMRFWKWVRRSGAKLRKKTVLVVPLHFFGSKNTISRFDERFRDGQYSLVSFMFAVSLVAVPPCPIVSAPLAP